MLCRQGSGEFDAVFHASIRVHVGASRNLELASRACDAALSWEDQSLIVAGSSFELDLDAFGVDLGLGTPVAAFQVKKSKADCCMEYKIYSLKNPPELLKSISGGDYFSASDTDLDGRLEIWTDDAAAVDGFENLKLGQMDFAPPVVLRFTRGKLMDVSSEFRPYYDQKIAELRTKLAPQDVEEFKTSYDRLAFVPTPAPADAATAAKAARVLAVKIRALEIVWSYLYSGREKEAWQALGELWPSVDAERIRAALGNARAHGILAQVEGVSTLTANPHPIRTKIFDATVTVTATPGLTPKDVKPKRDIVSPRAILMERDPPADVYEAELAKTESMLKLVIDAAGKVRSVEVMGGGQFIDEGLVRSTANWKFIPGFSEGEPVASQIFLGVSLKQ